MYNDGLMLDVTSYKNRVILKAFLKWISADAGNLHNVEEMEITYKFLQRNPFSIRMLKQDCLWLQPSDLRCFVNIPSC